MKIIWTIIYPELVPYCRLHEISYSCWIGNWVDVVEGWVVCMGQCFNPKFSNPLLDLYICDDSNENKMSVPLIWVEFITSKITHGLILQKRQRELYSDHSLSIYCLDWKVFFPRCYIVLWFIYFLLFFVPIVNTPMYNCTVLM